MLLVEKIYPDEWKLLGEHAHLAVFDERRSADLDRISYALIVSKDKEPCGYVTARETDAESVYWQFGGALPNIKNTINVFECYKAFIAWTKERYKRINTFVENTNIRYLKLAMACGFLITGIKNFKNKILVELTLEFEGEL